MGGDMGRLTRRRLIQMGVSLVVGPMALAQTSKETSVPAFFQASEAQIAEKEQKLKELLRVLGLTEQALPRPLTKNFLDDLVSFVVGFFGGKTAKDALLEALRDTLSAYGTYETQLKATLKIGKKNLKVGESPVAPYPPEVMSYAARRLPEVKKRRQTLEEILGVWTNFPPGFIPPEFISGFTGWAAVIADEMSERGLYELLELLRRSFVEPQSPALISFPLDRNEQSEQYDSPFVMTRKQIEINGDELELFGFKIPLLKKWSVETKEYLFLRPPFREMGLPFLPMVRVSKLTSTGPLTRRLESLGLLKVYEEPMENDYPVSVIYPQHIPVSTSPQLVEIQGRLSPSMAIVRGRRNNYTEDFLKQWVAAFFKKDAGSDKGGDKK